MKPARVIKLGGSLLSMPNLSEKFHHWCRENPHPMTLILVGGGGVVDAVRQIDRSNGLDERFAHWVCIDLLQHTARLAHHLLGEVEICETPEELQQLLSRSQTHWPQPSTAIVQVKTCFARNAFNCGLPESWDVTSDTLAAAFCHQMEAEELVVMKSRDLPSATVQWSELARIGMVDPHFADLAERIQRVRFVNLRR